MVEILKPANVWGQHKHCLYEMGSLAGPQDACKIVVLGWGVTAFWAGKGSKVPDGSRLFWFQWRGPWLAGAVQEMLLRKWWRKGYMWLNWVGFITDLEISASGNQEANISRAKESNYEEWEWESRTCSCSLCSPWLYVQGRTVIGHTAWSISTQG